MKKIIYIIIAILAISCELQEVQQYRIFERSYNEKIVEKINDEVVYGKLIDLKPLSVGYPNNGADFVQMNLPNIQGITSIYDAKILFNEGGSIYYDDEVFQIKNLFYQGGQGVLVLTTSSGISKNIEDFVYCDLWIKYTKN